MKQGFDDKLTVDARNREPSGTYRTQRTARAAHTFEVEPEEKSKLLSHATGRLGEDLDNDPLIGTTIDGRYTLERVIARGAMGCVYLGTQRSLSRPVAVKILDPKGGEEDRVFQERFFREAAVLARLQHPNTVRVIDYGAWKGRTYLVLEYVNGHSLRRLQSGGPIPPARLVHIATQICDALHEAHALGLIHRDLKPANVLLTRHAGALDVVKVVDFGLAKEFHKPRELTQAGQVLGTPMYMAPEQIRDEAIDQRVDIWALGVLMYRSITGKPPFDKGPAMKVLMANLEEIAPPFAIAAPEVQVPKCLEQVVMCCLEKKADDRFATVQEMNKALQICEIALERPDWADVTFQVVDGRVVIPEGLIEAGDGTIRVVLPRSRIAVDASPIHQAHMRTVYLMAATSAFAGVLGVALGWIFAS